MTDRERLRMAATVTWIAVLLAAVATCGSCAHRPGSPAAPRTARLRTPADRAAFAVEIQTQCIGDVLSFGGDAIAGGFGSGTLVGERTVLTAYHVVSCAADADKPETGLGIDPTWWSGRQRMIHVVLADKRRAVALVRDVDREHDLAVLEMERGAGLDIAPPALGLPGVGASLCIERGFPQRGQSCGAVSKIVYDGSDNGEVHHTATTIPGNSGGGVWDGEGRLVGVVTTRQFCDYSEALLALLGQPVVGCGGRAAQVVDRPIVRDAIAFDRSPGW